MMIDTMATATATNSNNDNRDNSIIETTCSVEVVNVYCVSEKRLPSLRVAHNNDRGFERLTEFCARFVLNNHVCFVLTTSTTSHPSNITAVMDQSDMILLRSI